MDPRANLPSIKGGSSKSGEMSACCRAARYPIVSVAKLDIFIHTALFLPPMNVKDVVEGLVVNSFFPPCLP